MTNPIERVARAMAQAQGTDPDKTMHGKPRWESYKRMAKAALSALLEPDDAVVQAGVFRCPHDPPDVAIGLPLNQRRQIFVAMIQSAKGGEG